MHRNASALLVPRAGHIHSYASALESVLLWLVITKREKPCESLQRLSGKSVSLCDASGTPSPTGLISSHSVLSQCSYKDLQITKIGGPPGVQHIHVSEISYLWRHVLNFSPTCFILTALWSRGNYKSEKEKKKSYTLGRFWYRSRISALKQIICTVLQQSWVIKSLFLLIQRCKYICLWLKFRVELARKQILFTYWFLKNSKIFPLEIIQFHVIHNARRREKQNKTTPHHTTPKKA